MTVPARREPHTQNQGVRDTARDGNRARRSDPAPVLDPVQATTSLLARTNGSTAGSCQGSRRRYRGVTDGSGTRLHSGQARRPPRPGAYGERSGPVLGGVARLLAVADLTVKTNIRTARRGTLRATRTTPPCKPIIGPGLFANSLASRRTYVSNAKLDKNAGRCAAKSAVPCQSACVQAYAVESPSSEMVGRRVFGLRRPQLRSRRRHPIFCGQAFILESPFLATRPRSALRVPPGRLGRGRSVEVASPGAVRPPAPPSRLAAERLLAAGGGSGSSPPKRPKNRRRGGRDDSSEVRFTASSRLPVTSLPRTASRYVLFALGTASTTSSPWRFF